MSILYKVKQQMIVIISIYGARAILTIFRLSQDSDGHISENDTQTKKYSLTIFLTLLCMLVEQHKSHMG